MSDVFTLREWCTCHSRCHGNRVHRKPKGDPSSYSVGVQPRFLAPFNVCALLLVAKDVNILFDELEAVNSPCKDDDSLLHPGNLTSTSEDASRLEAGGEVRVCMTFLKEWELPVGAGEAFQQTSLRRIPPSCRLRGSMFLTCLCCSMALACLKNLKWTVLRTEHWFIVYLGSHF